MVHLSSIIQEVEFMARIAGIFSLIAVLLVQMLSTSLIVTSFALNQETITDMFCVNKENPEMHCDGHCFLEKQIKADQKSHENAPKTAPEFISLIFTLSENIEYSLIPNFTKVVHQFSYILRTYSQFATAIYHPPKF